MTRKQMKRPPTRTDAATIEAVAQAAGACAAESDWRIAAAAVEPTHTHLLMTYAMRDDIDGVAKWIAQQTTKSIHSNTTFDHPLLSEGKWLGFIFDRRHWSNVRASIEHHNLRRELPARPWEWMTGE